MVPETVFCCFMTQDSPHCGLLYFQHTSGIELHGTYTYRSRWEKVAFISSLSTGHYMRCRGGQIMPELPVPHPRMLGFSNTHTHIPLLGSGATWCKGLCLPSPRDLATPAHSEELWLWGLGRKRKNMLPRRVRADACSRTIWLWDYRGHTGNPTHVPDIAPWTQPCSAVGSRVGQHQHVQQHHCHPRGLWGWGTWVAHTWTPLCLVVPAARWHKLVPIAAGQE